MAGRFNKILEFIGLVDDEPEEERELQGRRPVGGQTYGAQSRRAAPQAAPRGYEEPRSRYTSSRPEYDARARRSEAQPGASRYASGQGYQGGYQGQSGYQAQGRDYQSRDYQSRDYQGRDYQSRDYQSRDYRAPQRDDFEEAFEAKERSRSREQGRGGAAPVRVMERSHQTVIYYLRQLEECRDVINDLLDNKTVLLNLEDMDERVVQRGIDTLCGAAFALGATLRKASDKTYLIAPKSVEVASTNDQERRY